MITDGIAKVVLGKTVWAMHPFVGSKAHYWFIRSQSGKVYGIKSTCGKETVATSQIPLLNPGDWPKCKLCERAETKKP